MNTGCLENNIRFKSKEIKTVRTYGNQNITDI